MKKIIGRLFFTTLETVEAILTNEPISNSEVILKL